MSFAKTSSGGASRLASDRALAFGALPSGTDFDAIIGRSRPRVDGTAR